VPGVGVGESTAPGIEDAIEAGDEHVGGMLGKSTSLTPWSISAGKVWLWAARRNMPQVVDITSAAGTPLPVASPTASSHLACREGVEVVEVPAYLPG
jgi:hypothetical protein